MVYLWVSISVSLYQHYSKLWFPGQSAYRFYLHRESCGHLHSHLHVYHPGLCEGKESERGCSLHFASPCFKPRTSSQINAAVFSPGKRPGQCPCKEGYAGVKCDRCQFGYRGFPNCIPCDCYTVGSVNDDPCSEPCVCKVSVEVKETWRLFWGPPLHWITRSGLEQSREV